jgi:uncharacterized protein (DUF1697 family)
MIYLALLRGINVGGKNKVEMSRLKATFETAGFSSVRTYINTGNVIFAADNDNPSPKLASQIEKMIATEFGFPVAVLLLDIQAVLAVAEAIPPSWKEDSTMRCYVMFLWEDVDEPAVVERLTIKDDIDDVKYVPGAIVWRVDRAVLTRSGMMKVTNDELYRSMTIRNCNTVRKLAELMRQAEE